MKSTFGFAEPTKQNESTDAKFRRKHANRAADAARDHLLVAFDKKLADGELDGLHAAIQQLIRDKLEELQW